MTTDKKRFFWIGVFCFLTLALLSHAGEPPPSTAFSVHEIAKYKTGGRIDSSPLILDNGTVVIGSDDGFVYFIYSDRTLKRFEETDGTPIRSTPTVLNDGVTVVIPTYGGVVYFIDSRDLSLKAKYKTEGLIHGTPLVLPDNTVVVVSYDRIVHFINPDGTSKRIYEMKSTLSSSPKRMADGTVVFGTDDGYFNSITNETIGGGVIYRGDVGSRVFSSPALFNDDPNHVGLIEVIDNGQKRQIKIGIQKAMVGTEDGDVYLCNYLASCRQIFVNENFGSLISSPVLKGDTAFLASSDYSLYSVNFQKKEVNGRYRTEGPVTSTPLVMEDYGIIVLPSYDGYVHFVNDQTMELEVKHHLGELGAQIHSSPARLGNNIIVLASSDGYIYFLQLDGKSSHLEIEIPKILDFSRCPHCKETFKKAFD